MEIFHQELVYTGAFLVKIVKICENIQNYVKSLKFIDRLFCFVPVRSSSFWTVLTVTVHHRDRKKTTVTVETVQNEVERSRSNWNEVKSQSRSRFRLKTKVSKIMYSKIMGIFNANKIIKIVTFRAKLLFNYVVRS